MFTFDLELIIQLFNIGLLNLSGWLENNQFLTLPETTKKSLSPAGFEHPMNLVFYLLG